jgi:hypothetical protein
MFIVTLETSLQLEGVGAGMDAFFFLGTRFLIGFGEMS